MDDSVLRRPQITGYNDWIDHCRPITVSAITDERWDRGDGLSFGVYPVQRFVYQL